MSKFGSAVRRVGRGRIVRRVQTLRIRNERGITMSHTISTQEVQRNHRRLGMSLWAAQGTLALVFIFAGVMKLVLPIEMMTQQVPLPGAFLRFIGVCETLGAISLILPGV